MVPESIAATPTERVRQHRRPHGHSGGHRSRGKHRHRRKKSFGAKLKKGIVQFLQKNRMLLIAIFAALLVTSSLLWIFRQMERETIIQYSRQEAYE